MSIDDRDTHVVWTVPIYLSHIMKHTPVRLLSHWLTHKV